MIIQEHAEQMDAWRKLRTQSEDESAGDHLDRVEAALLNAAPRTAQEAANLVEIVRANLIAGGRSDGLDADALNRVSRFLLSHALT